MYRKIIAFLMIFTVMAMPLYAESQMENKQAVVGKCNEANPFGVLEFLPWDHEWNNNLYGKDNDLEKVVALMKEAGVGWVRLDFLWGDIEPSAGVFSFGKYDHLVELLSRNKINVLGILLYSADWASSCGKWNCPPRDNALFVNYAAKVVSRYKDKVKYWEVWNEPDSRTYWEDQDGLKGYCALLKDVYTELKKIDPDCKVLNGGFANGMASVNHLYDNGAKDYFDILNIHIFESPLNEGAAKRVAAYPPLAQKIMIRNADGHKKLWITEAGCPGVPKKAKVPGWWMGRNPDEQEQAAWVRQVYAQLLKYNVVDKVFWAFFRDTRKHWNTGTDYFGLVRWDFIKKPSFKAYQKCYRDWLRGRL
jgi:hypothetical protein